MLCATDLMLLQCKSPIAHTSSGLLSGRSPGLNEMEAIWSHGDLCIFELYNAKSKKVFCYGIIELIDFVLKDALFHYKSGFHHAGAHQQPRQLSKSFPILPFRLAALTYLAPEESSCVVPRVRTG